MSREILRQLVAVPLTKRQRWVLEQLQEHADQDPHDDDYRGEVVLEGRQAYLGLEAISPRTVHALLRRCVLRSEEDSVGGKSFERYTINETGRKLLRGEDPLAGTE